ncbi:MAG: pyridine nucleotide-disulfide oxidoreductase [Alphaproteobacteria bacterium]|nr:pyridine nucleotide-disulfide oxidoreductase [Alphaproteobacteria bacterium]
MTELDLGFGLALEDLYADAGLARLDGAFADDLKSADTELYNRLMAGRAAAALGAANSEKGGSAAATGVDGAKALTDLEESQLLIDLGPQVEDFIGRLFGITADIAALHDRHTELAPLYRVKRLFVQRRAVRKHKPEAAETLDGPTMEVRLTKMIGPFSELAFARAVEGWLADEETNKDALALAEDFAAWATLSSMGRARFGAGVLFQVPRKLDPLHLVPVETEVRDGVRMLRLESHHALRRREGFALTDPGMDLTHALDAASYCIFCHNQGKDSCAKGLVDRKAGGFAKSPFGVALAGCPLEEKISELNTLKSDGLTVAALAVVVVDNPMVAATGHRICNDCMKSCIYQKQEPVNIPQVETRALKDVLDLPWGFEIYGLLTRWNPMNLVRPVPKPASGYKVLVVGLGPAGFTLAHHLMNDGHAVVAVDGLKIEPLPADIAGVALDGTREPFVPVRDVATLYEVLDDRVMAGFGGVAEYGITVRWNKNFLKLIRLLLERRDRFAMFGGVRFGGTLTPEGAFAAGFDHIALAAGAGRPTILGMKNGLARGVRAASDFLMALQLTGAAKETSIANLQVRLPVVVVGGGLTAIDTATEALAYYPVQVEKFLARYEALAAEKGDVAVRRPWSKEEAQIADEFIAHARAIRAERAKAAREGCAPDIVKLLKSWGGSTIAYRRFMAESPSYTLNHEEVEKALEEGISFAEGLSPVDVDLDSFGHARALTLAVMGQDDGGRLVDTGEVVSLPARTVLVAAGTQPNTVLARETEGLFQLHGKWFTTLDEHGNPAEPEFSAKPKAVNILAAVEADGRAISFFGDLHPSFAGNVVKAMGSAKQGYPVVSRVLARQPPTGVSAADLFETMRRDLIATVVEVNRLTPTIVEVVVRAPAAVRAFHPGQFYRLQNYEVLAPRTDDTVLAMEGLAMTGAWVDREQGLVAVIVLEMGGSSDLCALLRPGERVVLMGPTGTPTEIPAGETVLLAGGGLGNAVLFSVGQAMRKAGSKVLYFAGYKAIQDRYKVEEIEAAADVIVWCCDETPGFTPARPQDRAFVGNIVEAIAAYGRGDLGVPAIALDTIDRVVTIGSDAMMAAVGRARHTVLKDLLAPGHTAVASINSPMQCMMKEICAQCLQPHVDPATGEATVVFSCFNQDQPLDVVDFDALRERLGQNRVQEKLTAQWIDHCLKQLNLRDKAAS